MDLDQLAEKYELSRWNDEHTSFTIPCPNDRAHTVTVRMLAGRIWPTCIKGCDRKALISQLTKGGDASELRLHQLQNEHEKQPSPSVERPADIASVGGPAAHTNGNGKVAHRNGNAPRIAATPAPHLNSQEIVERPDGLQEWKARIWRTLTLLLKDDPEFFKASLETIILKFGKNIDAVPYLRPPPDLSHIEAEEEIDRLVGLFLENEVPHPPAVPTSLPDLPELTRIKVEVLDWGQMRTRRASHVRDWAVEGMLARRETSSWSGKVEAGKTTLMRELTMAVIRGEPFLGRQTAKGRVFYAMLDADGEDVTYDEFAKLGFNSDDEPQCKFMFEPMMAHIEKGLEQFVQILQEFKPLLVIIDPYPRLKAIEDFHSYTNTYLMGMLSWMATTIDAHLALPGHIPRGRGDDDDVATAGFGSIAFSGGVNARFVVTNRSGIHTIRSSKGKAAGFVPFDAEYVVERNQETARIALGQPFSWKDKGRAAADPVASFLAANNDRCFDLASLAREIHLQKSVVRTALNDLFYQSRIKRAGEGLKKQPFVYSSVTYQGALTMEEVKRE